MTSHPHRKVTNKAIKRHNKWTSQQAGSQKTNELHETRGLRHLNKQRWDFKPHTTPRHIQRLLDSYAGIILFTWFCSGPLGLHHLRGKINTITARNHQKAKVWTLLCSFWKILWDTTGLGKHWEGDKWNFSTEVKLILKKLSIEKRKSYLHYYYWFCLILKHSPEFKISQIIFIIGHLKQL